ASDVEERLEIVPGPDTQFQEGDAVVVVGTSDALEQLRSASPTGPGSHDS
ncbi:MAG: hypothetical protein GWN71_29170, partial [Gammaproteobacteria bacterium]|nr:hypothetical protein [Gemmatimonadota bacterium]NIU77479.1 hypothetical protein [Gammaproteobacteria bacterium]